jgi:hypothetical protein
MPLLPVRISVRSSPHPGANMNKVALYGLEVPPGDIYVPAVPDFPATVSYFLRLFTPSCMYLTSAQS